MAGLPDKDSDKQLWQDFLAGDQAAFELLYHRHAPSVMRVLKSKSCPRHLAEEFCQEAMLRLWQEAQSDPPASEPGSAEQAASDNGSIGNVRSWLLRVATNLWIDLIRTRKNPARAPVPFAEGFDPVAPPTEDPLDPRLPYFTDCLKSIDSRFVAVVRELLAGSTVDQIAAAGGIPAGTVYTQAKRGRAQLEQCIESKQKADR